MGAALKVDVVLELVVVVVVRADRELGPVAVSTGSVADGYPGYSKRRESSSST